MNLTIKECLDKGLLRKTKPNLQKVTYSIKTAEEKLEHAEKLFDSKFYEDSIISAYTSMFHSSRALLFKDGYEERSHFALCIYISEKYNLIIENRFIRELNSLRLARHDLLYGLEKSKEVQEVEAEDILDTAKEYLKIIKKLLKV
ncbi:MAG: HEPN domain-containing protein [Candidatus Micrarchaeia archaeon]|jgi:uncharacterized protein (UPF0332 family)